MPPAQALRTAIIGTSNVGSFFDDRFEAGHELIPSSHASCYAKHPGTQLVAGCDVNPERLNRFGEKWGITALYTDFREMLANEKPDVVSVCTSWSHTHDEIVPEVARSGVRAIWAEKPLATSMAVADEIVGLVERNKIAFQCAYPRRFNARYQAVRALIEKELGEVVSVTIVGSASLLHDATHDTDAMAYFAGDPEPAFAMGYVEPEFHNRQGKLIQDVKGDGYVQHANGVRFFLEGKSFPGANTYIVSGTNARIIATNDCKEVELWRHPAERRDRWMTREPQEIPPMRKSPPLQQLEDLIDALNTGREPICNARQAAKFMEYCLAFHSSHRRGARVSFPIEDRQIAIDAS